MSSLLHSFFIYQFFNICSISSVQLLSPVWLFVTPWIAARQASSLSITNSQSSLRLTSIESVMPSSHLILCLNISCHSLLAWRVSAEKSADNLMGIPWDAIVSFIDIYRLPCIKHIGGRNLLYSTGNSAQCSAMTSRGRMGGHWEAGPRERGYMHTYSWFTTLYTRNWHTIIKKLYSNKKFI